MYRKSENGWVKHFDFLIIDILSMEIAYICAYFLRFGVSNLYNIVIYRNMAAVLVLIDIFVMYLWESFSGVLRRGYYQEFVATLKHTGSVLLMSIFYLFAFQMGNVYSRSVLFLTGGIYFIFSYITRLMWKRYLDKVKHIGNGRRSMLVVSTTKRAEKLLEELIENNYQRVDIQGLILVDADMVGAS